MLIAGFIAGSNSSITILSRPPQSAFATHARTSASERPGGACFASTHARAPGLPCPPAEKGVSQSRILKWANRSRFFERGVPSRLLERPGPAPPIERRDQPRPQRHGEDRASQAREEEKPAGLFYAVPL
ncbi:uncharacterized protein METZ01_LOCUS95624 [marine metagenome]|uniref:Uncharacterized protein n=1 Tax=marine metagenome TaxID=408172 RepID=A0A381VR23_9ZZZZ